MEAASGRTGIDAADDEWLTRADRPSAKGARFADSMVFFMLRVSEGKSTQTPLFDKSFLWSFLEYAFSVAFFR
jgi:hypothetical protein